MISLLNLFLVDNGYSYWNASTDPCSGSWERVTCTNNSVIQLDFSDFGFTNSSVISTACQIESLQALDLSRNYLNSIPYEFFTRCGKLSSLKSVDLSWNGVYGNLTSFMEGGFANLESLDLSYNLLYGTIEPLSDELVALKSLKLGSNHLTGSIPSHLVRNLKELDLSDNNFEGRIPELLPNCSNLRHVDLSYNRLTGTIPANISLCHKLLSLNLARNKLSGELPAALLGNLKHLQVLSLDHNYFVGFSIPHEFTHLDISSNLTNLKTLDLSNNNLSGSIPPILNLTNLVKMDLSNNNLSGSIPPILNLTNLVKMDLSNNNLSGSIPPILNLTNLEYLNLSNNKLSGMIPQYIGEMNHLDEIQLGNNCLVGDIPPMPINLGYALNLSNNRLQGQISPSLFQLYSLEILDLSNNRFSGIIPELVEDMLHLTYLNLSRNKLSGNIPSGLGSVYGYPSSLDLSYNNLSGPIPPSLQNFKYDAFVSNFDLYGKPVTPSYGNVEEGNNSSQQNEADESKDNFYIGLYVSIGIGFYFGFWGVCGTLVFKHTWRYALFNFVDSVYNRIYVTIAIYVARFQRKFLT